MLLSTMQAVSATVNEEWESDLADEILLRWEHDSGRAKYWRASTNFIFFFKRQRQDYVLRFTHASERPVAAIEAEVDYVNFLAEKGLRVAQPVRSLAGNYVEPVETSLGLFHAVVFEKVEGKQLDLEELTPDQVISWGKALGELHQISTAYGKVERPTWEEQLEWVAEILPAEEIAALQALDRLKSQLEQLYLHEENFGLVHYDFELDNILWAGDQPGIIDFDDSAWYWFVADIVFALRDLFGDSAEGVDLQDEWLLYFIQGYRGVRPLDQEELKLIPLFLRVHNLIAYARIYRALTPVNPAGEPAWMTDLRGRLVAKMQTYRNGFSYV